MPEQTVPKKGRKKEERKAKGLVPNTFQKYYCPLADTNKKAITTCVLYYQIEATYKKCTSTNFAIRKYA